jgi:hypothetical protein
MGELRATKDKIRTRDDVAAAEINLRPLDGLDSSYLVCLGAFAALDDVEFHLVALLQALVALQLDGAVMHEYVRALTPAEKSVSLCIVEPLDLPFVLRHGCFPRSLAGLLQGPPFHCGISLNDEIKKKDAQSVPRGKPS